MGRSNNNSTKCEKLQEMFGEERWGTGSGDAGGRRLGGCGPLPRSKKAAMDRTKTGMSINYEAD